MDMRQRGEVSTGELIIGLVISLVVLGVAVYWFYLASVGALPSQIGPGLPNNLPVTLGILVILAIILWVAYRNARRA